MNATQPTSSTPTISSVVATGRRMNIREGFMTLSRPGLECRRLHAGMSEASTRFALTLGYSDFPAGLPAFARLQLLEHSCFCLEVHPVVRYANLAATYPAHQLPLS